MGTVSPFLSENKISLADMVDMTEIEAKELFKKLRWPETDGEPVCTDCGSHHCYHSKSRPIFTCKHCWRQFSVTSGTLFAHRRLSLRHYLMAIVIIANSPKGVSYAQLSRNLGVQYKTAFVLANKIGEAISENLPYEVAEARCLKVSFTSGNRVNSSIVSLNKPTEVNLVPIDEKQVSVEAIRLILQAALHNPQSRDWSGYWQGNHSLEK